MRTRPRSLLTQVTVPAMRPIVVASLTIGVAAGVFAIAFGVGAVSAGGTVLQACVMSLLVFTGASQFSAVSIVDSGGSTASALGSAMLLAARNGVYGLTMARHLDGSLGRRLVAAQLTIDETTAMASAQDDPDSRRAAFWITGCAIFVCWNLGTLIGALAGEAINPETYGLDAAFPAGFVAMLAPHLRTRTGRAVALVGALICLATVPLAPIGVPILCAATAVLIGLRAP
jgi:4-azaleucine resistance transporter AzlC